MKYWKNLLATTFYGYFKVVLSLKKFLFAFVLPRGQFQILGFENFHSPLCTGGCKKIVYMPEILVSCHALRWPVRFFGDQRFSFAVIYLVRTLFVTLYKTSKTRFYQLPAARFRIFTCREAAVSKVGFGQKKKKEKKEKK